MSDQPSGTESADRKFGEKASAFLGALKPKSPGPIIEMVPRPFPKGASIQKSPTSRRSDAVLSLPMHLRTWWILPYALLPVLLFFAVIIGIFFGIIEPQYYIDSSGRNQYADGYFTILPMLIAIVVTIVVTFFIYHRTNPVIQITITPSTITIGKYRFKREYSTGLRIGYEVSYDNSDASIFEQKQILFTGLRLTYGQWGEDLPYMVNKYHAAEYVNWINSILDYVGSPEPRSTAPEEGRREQRF